MIFLHKLNKLFTYANAPSSCRRSVSMAVRYNLRRTWDPFPWIEKPIPPPVREPSMQHLPKIKGNHVLWIDLVEIEFGRGEAAHYPLDSNAGKPDTGNRARKMVHKLREIVKSNIQKPRSERIDSVVCYVKHSWDPCWTIWHALDGLSPKHLEIVSGAAELCHIRSLNGLRHPWNELESLSLTGICYHNFMALAPRIFSRVSSISLHYCSGRNFIPCNATRLKHLHLSENNACDMFLFGANNNPTFTQTLEVLEIESTVGCDFVQDNEPEDFREALRKCTNLREFRLATSFHNDLDTNLASYIPPSIEKLVLRFGRSSPLLKDMDEWTSLASDPTWLPQLNSFQLTVDPKIRGLDDKEEEDDLKQVVEPRSQGLSPEEFDWNFENKRPVLYDILSASRPQLSCLM